MKKVLSALQMRQAEQAFFATGVTSLALMERAAVALNAVIERELNGTGKTCVFACGPGGNGGDGYAAARLFAQSGGRAIILPVYPPRTSDARANYEKALNCVFASARIEEIDRLPVPDAWVDCIFGIGASRAAQGEALQVMRRINADHAKGVKVFSADIPSGLCADTGRVFGECVRADHTIAFQALKRGHLSGEGLDVCGQTEVCPIGIPEELIPPDAAELIEAHNARQALPQRKRTAHKNDFGHLLIVAGSRGMAGAAAICARAAMRAGAGLTTIACPESLLCVLQTLAPCAMCLPLPEENGALGPQAAPLLNQALTGKTALAVGCGLSRNAAPECVRVALQSGLPAVFDADALNIIAGNGALKALLSSHHALTPHPGEAARLLGETVSDAFTAARKLHALGANALVKGAATVIQGERTIISTSGCVSMAKGGSGDALTGIIGALLAQGLDTQTALAVGSEIHGLAGEIAARRYGSRSMLPTDLIEFIGAAMDGEGA